MFDWNDLRFLFAVARDGSTIAAARSFGVNQSTVQRRLAELKRASRRHGSVLSLLYAVKAGVGIAALPTAVADAEPTLRRVPRVAAFFDHMVDEIDALRPIITG